MRGRVLIGQHPQVYPQCPALRVRKNYARLCAKYPEIMQRMKLNEFSAYSAPPLSRYLETERSWASSSTSRRARFPAVWGSAGHSGRGGPYLVQCESSCADCPRRVPSNDTVRPGAGRWSTASSAGCDDRDSETHK